jgi:cyclic-di-GMP-binding protein
MANNFSFDIVSEIDLQEVDNAVNQALKEVAQRFDFKGSKSFIEFNRTEKKLELVSDDNYKLKSLRELFFAKLAKRGVSSKSLEIKEPEKATGDTVRQAINLVVGIPKERAKELVKIIKGLDLRVQAQIDDIKLRVFSPKKDDLQAVITHLRSIDFPVALQFNNYR